MRINPLLAVFLFLLNSHIYGKTGDSLENENSIKCSPTIIITNYKAESRIFCLNDFTPANDSCAAIELKFKNGLNLQFKYNQDDLWTCEESGFEQQYTVGNTKVNIEISKDGDGFLQKVTVEINTREDSNFTHVQQPRDLKIQCNTFPPEEFSILSQSFLCRQKAVVTERTFTYPPGYMHRCPVYNYPELSMFHYGGQIKMPNSSSLNTSAYIANYWHILYPPKIKYDDPEIIRKREIRINKQMKINANKKPAHEKKPAKIKFKPL